MDTVLHNILQATHSLWYKFKNSLLSLLHFNWFATDLDVHIRYFLRVFSAFKNLGLKITVCARKGGKMQNCREPLFWVFGKTFPKF